jgi:hypothetical protein
MRLNRDHANNNFPSDLVLTFDIRAFIVRIVILGNHLALLGSRRLHLAALLRGRGFGSRRGGGRRSA